MQDFQVSLSLWVHRHHTTHQPIEVEVFSVSGYRVPVDFFIWLNNHRSDADLLQAFSALKTEHAYDVLCWATWNDDSNYADFYLEPIQWLQVTPVDNTIAADSSFAEE